MLLAALLASASLTLQPLAPGQAGLRLCFDNPSPAIRYELRVIARGPAGRSQTRQSGMADSPCPVRNRLDLQPATRVQAQLRWWLDGVEQTPVTAEAEL